MLLTQNSPLQEIPLAGGQIRLLIKRDDLLHPFVSGNKMRKMKYNLREMRRRGQSKILTFGGAFSNHIAAVAAAGRAENFATVGIIRGERPAGLNPTLRFAEECGMQLRYISRSAYRRKEESDFLESLQKEHGDFYLLPEGGTNCFALQGCAEIIEEIKAEIIPDYYCVCCGTGGTIAGMIQGAEGKSEILGFSALKGDFLEKEVEKLLQNCGKKSYTNWSINSDFHCGGYAEFTPELIDFINKFKAEYGIALDPIYTGKMFFGIFSLLEKGYFEKGSTVVAVHTGGLQGVAGFNERFGNIIEV